jgi:hypothetical protein
MFDSIGRYEIGNWYTTENDNDAIKCVVIDNLIETFGELSNQISIDEIISEDNTLIEKGQPILTFRFSEDLTGNLTAFKTGIIKNLKHKGEKIKPGEIICKIYPYWQCPYCLSAFSNKADEQIHEKNCRLLKRRKFENKIPKFNKMLGQISQADKEVREFYLYWLAELKKNNFIDVEDNLSYLFYYTYQLLTLNPKERIRKLRKLFDAYHNQEKYIRYSRKWLSDSYLITNDFENALRYFPKIKIGIKNTFKANALLSLKLKQNKSLNGADLITLLGPNVTDWGKKQITEISNELTNIIRLQESIFGSSLLKDWSNDSRISDYNVFEGTWSSDTIKFDYYNFGNNPRVIEIVRTLFAQAENVVRERFNIPKIGEGWISETELFYNIKEYFKKFSIVHHGKPKWLGKQHLDIFIPELNIGIEYQGAQHYEAVDYFGGVKSFEKTKKLDKKKKVICAKNNCSLIFVNEGYKLDKVIEEISDVIKRKQK